MAKAIATSAIRRAIVSKGRPTRQGKNESTGGPDGASWTTASPYKGYVPARDGLSGGGRRIRTIGPSRVESICLDTRAIATWPFLKYQPRKSGSHETHRWRDT